MKESRQGVIDQVYDKLKRYKSPSANFHKKSLRAIRLEDLRSILAVDFQHLPKRTCKRPLRSPRKSFHNGRGSSYDYKLELVKYLRQWGIEFADMSKISNPILETLANYLENNSPEEISDHE